MLAVQDIHTYYGDSYILQGVSLKVSAGTIITLVGRNGVGKTTLIRSIIGFTPPRSGKIIFKDIDIVGLAPEQIARAGIGLVPQGRRLFPSLTVHENLIVAAHNKGPDGWAVENLFELFPRLRERSSQMASKLSGGEQQMLAIARSLMTNPDLLLMDEPTEGLAPLIVDHLGDVLFGLKEKGLSVLLVEQNLVFAQDLADYVYMMNKGEIVYESSIEEFRENTESQHLYLGI
ncbi:MAG: ABC transporter ATP-binding protein [Thermodesulfobacteriota bacterium]